MAKKRQIQPVKNNLEKQVTYRRIKAQYKTALENEYFLEALLIAYAMLEDRLLAFLYHSGIQRDRENLSVPPMVESDIREIIKEYKKSKETDSILLNSISSKSKIIRCLVLWASETDQTPESRYLSALKMQYEGLDSALILDTLSCLNKWIPYRNEVVHALLHKNTEDLHLELDKRVKEGKTLADRIDSQVKILKKNPIREEFIL